MKLDAHLSQSRLLYLVRDNENINIRESEHYRFLCFDHIVQSIMLKRNVGRLTLPHQYFIALPLIFFRPKQIIELGLGGGNILRFIHALYPECHLTSVENNLQVVQCFQQYFNPQNININIELQEAEQWLAQQKCIDANWLICDIFQQQRSDLESLNLIKHLLHHLPANAWLTVNLVDLTDRQLEKVLRYLAKIKQQRQLTYFNVPQYKNTIIHIHPAIGDTVNNLTGYQAKRWRKLWQQGMQA